MSTHRIAVTLDPGPPENNPRMAVAPDMLELLPEAERATLVDLIRHALKCPDPSRSRCYLNVDSIHGWARSTARAERFGNKRASGKRPPGDPDRYQDPIVTGEQHPLKDVPFALLEAGRDALWEVSAEGDIDVDLVEPVADVLTLALWSWMKENQ